MPTFHAIICMLEWFTCIGGMIYGIIKYDQYKWLWAASALMIWFIPIFNELFLCFKGACCKRRV